MKNNKMKYYKKYNLKQMWEIAHFAWVKELFNFPLMSFLEKFKNGEKLFYRYLKLRFFITGKPALPWLQLFMTTKCTMNCKHCNTFIPKYTPDTHAKPINFNQFKKDLNKFLKAVDFINVAVFIGGEPLLASELDKMMAYAIKQKKIKHVMLATNCTILPSEKLIKVLKNKKVSVQISDYHHVKNIKGGVTVKYEEMKNILNLNNIRYNAYQEKRGAQTWLAMPDVYKDKVDEKTAEKLFEDCYNRYCPVLCDGKITKCTIANYIERNLELTDEIKNEVINIREIPPSLIKKELISFYSRPYSEFCHYCHFNDLRKGLPCGEQVE